jgi:hypothetical protein
MTILVIISEEYTLKFLVMKYPPFTLKFSFIECQQAKSTNSAILLRGPDWVWDFSTLRNAAYVDMLRET